MNFAADMAEYEDEWAASPQEGLPDGYYQARLAWSGIERRDWGWQWSLRWDDLNGAGFVWQRIGLSSQGGRNAAAQTARALGYQGTLGGLYEAAPLFAGAACEIRVRRKQGREREFVQVYVQRLLEPPPMEPPPSEPEGGGTSDADIPF